MRYLALLALCVLAMAAPAGAFDATEQSDAPVRVTGTVTHANGTPAAGAHVLLGSRALLEKSSPDRLLSFARDDPGDVTAVRTGADGGYAAVAPSPGAVVAVTERGTSDVHRVDGNSTVNLTLGAGKALTFQATGGATAPGNTTRARFDLRNDDDVAVEGLRLTVGELPDGWAITGHEVTGGVYHPANRTFTWASLAPGEWAEASLTIHVPSDAEHGTYAIPLAAASPTHRVDAWTASVEVRPPETPGETPTALPGDDETARETTARTTPGFGSLAGLVAFALLALAARRTD